jgi:hypothetical protein
MGFDGGTLAGAVYSAVVPPATEIVPSVVFPLAMPFTSQMTGATLIPQKLAVKLCVCPRARVVAPGEIEFVVAQTIVIIALADFVVSETLVAVTVTLAREGTFKGAVYSAVVTPPDTAVATIVPTVAFPPLMPPTASVTAGDELPSPVTVIVKTMEPPAATLAVVGLSETDMAVDVCTGVVLSDGAEVCPHEERDAANRATTQLAFARSRFVYTNSNEGNACATAAQYLRAPLVGRLKSVLNYVRLRMVACLIHYAGMLRRPKPEGLRTLDFCSSVGRHDPDLKLDVTI